MRVGVGEKVKFVDTGNRGRESSRQTIERLVRDGDTWISEDYCLVVILVFTSSGGKKIDWRCFDVQITDKIFSVG